MKTSLITRGLSRLAVGIFLFVGLIAPKQADAKNNMGVSFQVFYDELAPYGDWVKDARYGYIWLPAVREDFHPYGSNGHWVMTGYGNTWVSNYDWGWAPFHYGRWYFDDYFQSWAWIPGYDWAPAWVDWRAGGGYYGWAPVGPVSMYVNVIAPSFHWVFIPNRHIHHHYAYQHYAPYRSITKIYNNTTIINNTVVYNNRTYVGGPQPKEIERVTRKVVPVYAVQESQAPGRSAVSRNTVNLYKPEVQERRGRTTELKPSRVLGAQETKSARSSREFQSTTPSRNSSPSLNSGGRTVESSPRATQNSTKPATSLSPGRSVSPAGKEESKKPVVTPMPSQSQNRSTTTAPSRSESNGSRQATPTRSTEVKKEGSRTQQPAPSRGTVQPAKPAQAPARSQSPAVNNSKPANNRVSEPAKSQPTRSSPQVRTSTPAKSTPATNSRTSSTTSSRTTSSGRNN